MATQPTVSRELAPEDVAAREALRWFAATGRTEPCFHLRWQRMPDQLREALKARWRCDDWGAFRRICSFFGVDHPRRRQRGDAHLLN